MRDVHFLLDEVSEQDKKEIKDIIRKIKTRTQKTPKEVAFLRKFTLSLMKQYMIKKSIPTTQPSQLRKVKETQSVVPKSIILMPRTAEIPEQIQIIHKIPSNDIPEPVRLTETKSETLAPAPEPLRLVDLHRSAPSPQVPIPNKAMTDAIKKELSIPVPTPLKPD